MGAIAFYKLLHRKITRIVVPINRKGNAGKAPVLAAVENADGTVTFTVTLPEKQEYECYRIVMQSGIYAEDYITYEAELTVPRPRFTGEYQCYAVGYGEEGQLYSQNSNMITLFLIGENGIDLDLHSAAPDNSGILQRIFDLEQKVAALESQGGD